MCSLNLYKNKNKIGLFGGTFNPPHKGHERVALEFYKRLNLDKLIIIPSNIPPHKEIKSNINKNQRLELTRLCFEKYNYSYNYNIEVSDVEIKKQNISYTVFTVRKLKEKYDNLYFLVGSDMYLYIEHWYNYQELLNLCTFVCALRNNCDTEKVYEMQNKLNLQGYKSIIFKDFDFLEISSTELRKKIKNCENLDKYLSPEVIDYIKERRIYDI